jgi:general secretion pathway protein E
MTTDLRPAIQSARRLHREGGGAVLDILLRSTALPAEQLAEALRGQGGVRLVAHGQALEPDFTRLDLQSARRWRCVALRAVNGAGVLACEDPWDDRLVRQASGRLGGLPELGIVSRELLDAWLGLAGEARPAVAHAGTTASPAHNGGGVEGPVVAFVDDAIRAGYRLGASDIHFECDREGVTVKHRLDGVMTRHARLDSFTRAEEVISRLKVLAQLDITERRLPQDGRFRATLDGGAVDLRVSIMPSVFGEDAVLRLLDKAQLRQRSASITLDTLGFDTEAAERLRELASLPHGMLLITGPTGSGKTTTVYAALSEINTGLEKIITIEDPVEYELSGVLQIPVNERKGLTFAKGLRSILRHDPDRILVGEIRDAETAEIATQSALTGHQVFTTVHANSIFDVMGRFRHFGLDMFGFMSALNGVVVQRLVRRLCPHCRGDRAALPAEAAWLQRHAVPAAGGIGAARGCELCHHTGYKGRFVLAEVHQVDDGLRDLVTGDAAVSALKQHVQAQGNRSLAQQAAAQVLARETTIEEVRRVVGLA